MSREIRVTINVEEYGTIHVNSLSESNLSLSLEDTDGETMTFELSSEEVTALVDSISEVQNFIRFN